MAPERVKLNEGKQFVRCRINISTYRSNKPKVPEYTLSVSLTKAVLILSLLPSLFCSIFWVRF